MPRYASRVDANHRDILRALERVGFTVVDFSSIGRGVPDLYAIKGGEQFWVEVKDGSRPPSERKLTPDQVKFRAKLAKAGVHVHVVESVDQALRLAGVQ